MLHDSAQRVSVCDDYDTLTLHDLRTNVIIPIGEHTIASSLERLGCWENFRWEICISPVKSGMTFIILFHWRWRNVIAASPLQDFIFSVLLSCFYLVQTLQGTIVSFVQSPSFVVRKPKLIQFNSYEVIGLQRTS